jgi:membrane-bound lytic murein transglycosylase D
MIGTMQHSKTFSLKPLLSVIAGAAVVILAGCGAKEAQRAIKQAPIAMAPAPVSQTPAAPAVATPEPQPKPAEPAEKVDPVPAMIAQAEKAVESGQENFKAGHLDAAKQDFSRASDILTQGPVDVKSDDRLQAELDKITDEITKFEAAAIKPGNGFGEQPSEPAPIDEANMEEPPVDPNVKARAEANLTTIESDLPLMINDYVAGYISYFSSRGRSTFESALVRSGRYRDMIRRVFKEEGVPQDLIYLAQAESGFKPLALSRARARGMWQFMSSRGVGYGLRRSWWVDDRQDPERATRAAARHLKDLYNQFGDWYLAMAAYNSGPGNVQQAVRRTGYADFWELYKRDVLPRETKNYVPIILAMTIMSKKPAQYGLDGVQPEPPEQYDVVRINYPVDLRLVADCVETPVDALVDLNPSLLRRATPKDQPFDLHLPAGTKDKYEAAIAAVPEDKRVAWRYHTIKDGETLASVAKKYRTTERAITQANNLDGSAIAPDTKLVIPVSAAAAGVGKIVYSRYPTRYRTHTGDTVLSVSEDFGVPPDRLRRWNKLKGNNLSRGRMLVVYKPLGPGEPDRAPVRRRKKSSHTSAKTVAKAPAAKNNKEKLEARSQ